MWSLWAGGLLARVNYREKCTFGGLEGQSLKKGGHLTQVVLSTKADTPLFATTAVPLQLYHSPRGKSLPLRTVSILVLKDHILKIPC